MTEKEFEQELKNRHISLNGFLELFNMWVNLSIQKRGNLIKKLAEVEE